MGGSPRPLVRSWSGGRRRARRPRPRPAGTAPGGARDRRGPTLRASRPRRRRPRRTCGSRRRDPRRADGRVRQEELAEPLVVARRRRHLRLAEPAGLRGCVRVQDRLLHRDAGLGHSAGPEAERDLLVRVRLARDRIRAGPLRRAAPGEPRDREIEGAPEEVDGALLPDEAFREPSQRRVAAPEHLPEPVGRRRIVRARPIVPVEGNGIGDLDRCRPEVSVDADRPEERAVLVEECVDRARPERHRPRSIPAPRREDVVHEVQLEVDHRLAVAARRGAREPPGRDAERRVPPVVLRRGERRAASSRASGTRGAARRASLARGRAAARARGPPSLVVS